ncbi:two-component system, CitB family, response regulator/two-component system, CitB family, response regulator MalR [Halobacillus karajensis]|uniref:Transcriptional regulatory protein DcuR n=1 Tax=Halobacillus karajensis TaxID=195088 RepID=A0A024P866_9BACI|nr:response regulator [Halobacillus karajensis]CDQ20207.1 Transcriptional regulatory protein DcuR [Halobacillus karajensis]CDQ25130.1 Transcriptional regulatory protein DcuR [Halobacillus karajensis]CDQ28509.1 Transcriptional regulatory protein DcuR [Halobacillus karajensis]SEI01960.1 two-component system, CitB family, response regulator/two-component system, CitB family, response regulator MalR [Halobacillus karajensis]
MIHVLIVEDDPMVANLNKKYVEQVDGFYITAMAANEEEAIHCLEECRVDLILLDVYMPGRNGLQLLKELRRKEEQVDVILITAASEKEQIQKALRLGAIDYLIKPFEFDRLQGALGKYKEKYAVFEDKQNVSQDEIDRIFIPQENRQENKRIQVPKGLTQNTLELIIRRIRTKENEAFSTDEIAQDTEVSRVSVRKYLKFLKEIDFLEETLVYGVGRPVYQYQIKNTGDLDLEFYH